MFHAAWRRSRPVVDRRRGLVVVAVAVVVLMASVAALFGTGQQGMLVRLLSGHGWLTQQPAGAVDLVNGASGTVDLQLKVRGTAGDNLSVVDAGKQALLVDRTTGRVGRIDLGDFKVTNDVQVAPSGGRGGPESTQYLAGNNVLFVVQPERGTVEVRSPLTNRLIAVAHQPGRLTHGVVSASGRLWTVDASTGRLLSWAVVHRRLQVTKAAGVVAPRTSPGEVEMALVAGVPAVLDLADGRLMTAPGGTVDETVHVPFGQEETDASVAMAMNDPGPVVPLVVAGEGVSMVDLTTQRVTRPYLPASVSPSNRLGAPVQYGNRIYVPDETTEKVVVLATSNGASLQTAAAPISLPGPSGDLSLSVQGGYVWADNPQGNQAVAVSTTGAVTRIQKYSQSRIASALTPQAFNSPLTALQTPAILNGGPQAVSPTSLPTLIPSAAPAPTPSTPAATPGAPSVTAVPGPGSATVSWKAPTSGSPITGYQVTWQPTSGGAPQTATLSSTTTSDVLQPLQAEAYLVTVQAVNSAGLGAAGTATVTPGAAPLTAPGAPTGVSATASPDGSVQLTWQAPQGGGAVTTYTITSQPSSSTVQSTTTSATVGNLAPGTSYTFDVTASNSAGSSSAATATATTYSAATISALTILSSPSGVVQSPTPPSESVSFTYSFDARLASSAACQVTVNSVAVGCSLSGASGTVTVPFTGTGRWASQYQVTVDIIDGSSTIASSGAVTLMSQGEQLTVNANEFFNCSNGTVSPYCGANAGWCLGTAFTSKSCGNGLAQNATVTAICQLSGSAVSGVGSGSGVSSSTWVEIGPNQYMSTMWFSYGTSTAAASYLNSC